MDNEQSSLRQDCPKNLFRFRSCDTNYFESELQRVVSKQEQYFASIDVQNDPFDCNPKVENNTDKEILDFYRSIRKKYIVSEETLRGYFPTLGPKGLKALRKKNFSLNFRNMKAARKATKDLISVFRNQSKIICLTERWDSPLHWAHYATGHNGIALSFRTDIDLAMAQDDDIPLGMMYSKERPVISEIDVLCWLENPNGSRRTGYDLRATKAFDAFTSSKSIEWRYEKEWRVQKRFEGPGTYCFVPALKLDHVIIGTRVCASTKEMIQGVCRGQCELYQAVLNPAEYKLELVGL